MFNGKKGMVLLCLIVFFTVILTALNCPDWRGHLIVENHYNIVRPLTLVPNLPA